MPIQVPSATSSYATVKPAGTDNHISDTSQTESTSGPGSMIDVIFEDGLDKKVTMEDSLILMVVQLKSQDFMNPMGDTQYVTQLTQISTIQQMEEMSYNAESAYMSSLADKYVATAKLTVLGELRKTEGIVDKISLPDEKFVTYVNGESYSTDEIMGIKIEPANNPDDNGNEKPDEDKNPEKSSGKA